jgi:hypothetical protein
MFYDADAFNQRDLVRWDVANVESFNQIFLQTALENDECSKLLMYGAWRGGVRRGRADAHPPCRRRGLGPEGWRRRGLGAESLA